MNEICSLYNTEINALFFRVQRREKVNQLKREKERENPLHGFTGYLPDWDPQCRFSKLLVQCLGNPGIDRTVRHLLCLYLWCVSVWLRSERNSIVRLRVTQNIFTRLRFPRFRDSLALVYFLFLLPSAAGVLIVVIFENALSKERKREKEIK